MSRNSPLLLPRMMRILEDIGTHLKLARLRRKMSAEQMAERANLTRYIVGQIEKGSPAVSMGAYAQVLFVLGMEADLKKLAADDLLGRKLQDLNLSVKARAPKKSNSHGKSS